MMGKMLSIFGSVQLADQLDRLSFTENGNVTARFWESDEDSGNSGIPDMKEFDEIIKSLVGPDGKYHPHGMDRPSACKLGFLVCERRKPFRSA